jgi:hypothetical protein
VFVVFGLLSCCVPAGSDAAAVAMKDMTHVSDDLWIAAQYVVLPTTTIRPGRYYYQLVYL